jgi:predicted kinase
MRKLILVGGYCATGKSTFSRRLSERLGWLCLNKDTLKEVVAETLTGIIPRGYSQPLSITAYRLMLHAAERSMTAGQPLILESNFRRHETAGLGALAEAHGYGVLTYLFTADLRVVFDRYLAREGTPERHWVHALIGDAAFEDFAGKHTQFGEIELGRMVNVDAADFNAIDYEGLFHTAEKFAAG